MGIKMQNVIEAKNVALDKALEEEKAAAMKDAEGRIRELQTVKMDKAAEFRREEKDASFADRSRLMKEHQDQLKALDNEIENEKTKQLQKVEERLGKKREALRQEIALKEKQLAQKKRVKDGEQFAIDEGVIKEVKPIEKAWQSRAMVWMVKARRKIAMKKEEDEAKAKADAGKRKRR